MSKFKDPYCFDTCIYIGRPRAYNDDGAYLSSVVALELMGGAEPDEMKRWMVTWADYQKRGRLLVPMREDWLEALNRLHVRAKKTHRGQAPKISSEERHRMRNDVLIVVTARRAGVTVVTENSSDFKRIHEVSRVKFVSDTEFFGD